MPLSGLLGVLTSLLDTDTPFCPIERHTYVQIWRPLIINANGVGSQIALSISVLFIDLGGFQV